MAVSIVLIPLILLALLLGVSIPVLLGLHVYRDAKARGMEPLLWTLIALLAPGFVGLIIYLVVRRSHVPLSCPQCGEQVGENYTVCPNCGQKLAAACRNCGTQLKSDWKLCPNCGTPVTDAEPFLPPVANEGAGNQGLLAILIVIMLVPVLALTIVVVGFIGLRSYAVSDMDNETEFNELVASVMDNTVKRGVFTVQDASLPQEATDWIAAKRKEEKTGLFARTFCETEGTALQEKRGSGFYDVTYASVVVVINDGDGEQFVPGEMAWDEDGGTGITEDIQVELTGLSAVPEVEKMEEQACAELFGNVFVLRFPIAYDVEFDFKNGHSNGQIGEMESDSINVAVKCKGKTVTCEVPVDPDSEDYYMSLPTAAKD